MAGYRRSYRSLRRRYRRAQRLAALVGAAAGTTAVAMVLRSLRESNLQPTPLLVLAAMLLVVCCAGVPWLVVGMLWRWRSRTMDDG
jgi:hypothetical protein